MRAALFALCCLLLATGLNHAAGLPPDFSGDWVTGDQADAAAPAAKSSSDNGGHSHSGHGGGMGGGGHGTGGGRGGHGNNSSSNSDSSAGANANTSVMPREHAHALIIRPSDDVFDIEANGRRMAYRYDGKRNYGPQYGGTVSADMGGAGTRDRNPPRRRRQLRGALPTVAGRQETQPCGCACSRPRMASCRRPAACLCGTKANSFPSPIGRRWRVAPDAPKEFPLGDEGEASRIAATPQYRETIPSSAFGTFSRWEKGRKATRPPASATTGRCRARCGTARTA